MANYSTGTLGVNYGTKVFINVSNNPLDPSVDPVWAEFGDGINNLNENLNENVIESYYLINHGWGNTEVTAMHPNFEVSGVRMRGDVAQDWIFKKKFKMLDSRKTQMKVQVFNPDNPDVMYDSYKVDITISNLKEIGGSTESGSEISMTLSFNGSPTFMANSPVIKAVGSGTSEVKFTIISTTEDTNVYYTTDGTIPDETKTLYSGEVTLSTAGTYVIKAVAVPNDSEMDASDVVSKSVTIITA